jgi:hypothetical protein
MQTWIRIRVANFISIRKQCIKNLFDFFYLVSKLKVLFEHLNLDTDPVFKADPDPQL